MNRTPIPALYIRDALTTRELQVIRSGASGASNKAIARSEHITEQTVKFHMSNVFRKLGVDNRTAAVWRCMQLGLIDPPSAAEPPPACPTCERPYL